MVELGIMRRSERSYKHLHEQNTSLSKSSIGRNLVLTSFGESHAKCIGAVLDGCPAGLRISEKDIQPMLDLRKPGQSAVTTQRKEPDKVEILSGVFRGRTTGSPIAMVLQNKDTDSRSYDALLRKLRPGHSDYTAMVKYGGHNDHRGGGHFSGRLTATHVMGGAIAKKLLNETLGVKTHSYTAQIGSISLKSEPSTSSLSRIYKNDVRCPDPKTAKLMRDLILATKRAGDSLGGIVRSVTTGLPVGLGEPMFGSVESEIGRAMFSIPSVKGVEFGSGFFGASSTGSQNNDIYDVRRSKIITRTNNSGGILGGITNGMPVTMNVAFKPVSTIGMKQPTVDIRTRKATTLQVKGRHDPCVVPRAPPIVDSLVSLVFADLALVGGFVKQTL